uniref:Uncharacterized protein n=1 Tax=Lactuca sativa TaxID=4236 RepID=A0A9R1W1Z7_LACSA|nr:hypothetical protein LSAT_V11C300120160 [Lactuca sativa]
MEKVLVIRVNAFRSMMHDKMMVGIFSHSTAVRELRKDLPCIPTNACVMFPTSYRHMITIHAFEYLLDRQLIEFADRRHNRSIEFRAVKLLISSSELH